MKKITELIRLFNLPMLLLIFQFSSYGQFVNYYKNKTNIDRENIVVGANQTHKYLKLLKDKNVAIVCNNTSVIFKEGQGAENQTHLVDSLLNLGINISKVFAPEHGLRGNQDAGEKIIDSRDSKTNLPVISLYGFNYKPLPEQIQGLDLILFDIQDVGARFYTYLSTMHYIMESCAEKGIPVIVLDRPNPNGHYVDGPVVAKEFKSPISSHAVHPVPIVYGMTIGEYAKMINGEKWLKNGIQSDLTVIPLENYTHDSTYSIPLRPSPNLPNDKSINLYPSLCLFEGTDVNSGRGTEKQFQVFGSPFLLSDSYDYTYIPKPNFGSKNPKHMGTKCYGLDLSENQRLDSLNLSWLIEAYNSTTNKDSFFRQKHFDRLAGSEILRKQIIDGMTFPEIRDTWKSELSTFMEIRKKYLIYP